MIRDELLSLTGQTPVTLNDSETCGTTDLEGEPRGDNTSFFAGEAMP